MSMIEGTRDYISGISSIVYAHNNQVQLCITRMEMQLDQIQRKLELDLSHLWQKGKKFFVVNMSRLAYSKGGAQWVYKES